LIGLYKDKKLFKTYKSNEKTSDILPEFFTEIESKYNITALYYAKGPGSFMSIKVSYVFLKSYAIAKNIKFKAVDGFYFNNNAPIKALGKTYFVKEGNNITFDTITPKKNGEFYLPQYLNHKDFSNDTLPLYILPAAIKS
jgi:tRNA A37 threonylcarbamoyladenosine modification protein TsaB